MPSAAFSRHPLANISTCCHPQCSISASIKEFCQIVSAGHRGTGEPEDMSQGRTVMARCPHVHAGTWSPEDTSAALAAVVHVGGWGTAEHESVEHATYGSENFTALGLFLFVLMQLSHCHSQLADWVLEATTRKSFLGMPIQPIDLPESGEGRCFCEEECIEDKVF